jgi:phage tail sheath protein FI
MGQMKTPGVYIVEKSAFPNSVVEVATAVPAFIGCTEKADNMGTSLANKPWRITSMADFHKYFGFGPVPMFDIKVEEKKTGNSEAKAKEKSEKPPKKAEDTGGKSFSFDGKTYHLNQASGKYLLYYSMLLFYQNGGGPCYIVSVGSYGDSIELDSMQKGIDLLIKEQEPTMVVMPDAVLLDVENCISLQQAALAHCGGTMKNRVAILDVWNGYHDRQDPPIDCIADFRNRLGINYLDYAAAYYPWVNTTIIQDKDLDYENIANRELLQTCLLDELGIDPKELTPKETDTPAEKSQKAKKAQQKETIDAIMQDWDKAKPPLKPEDIVTSKMMLNKSLVAMSPLFNTLLLEIKNQLNLLPPSAAMAGIYTMVDNSRGVWKAPANVSLNAVVSPAVNITHDDQEDLNVTPMGKSINAIRTFIGEGTLVWGARTLDGNSLDWRYISVRRTLIMLEESIKLAAKAYVFEDNVATTWVTISSMISNFLTGIWKRGGLAGATPQDAFQVFVGLGETMTPEDILEGILRVTVLVAVTRPAEFIEITFQQQMQKS